MLKKCDLIAFLNTAFYSYDENVFCGNRCYLFCTSILHDIKVKRGHKKKGKKSKKQKRSDKKKTLGSVCHSFFGDKSLHADKGRAF